MISYRSLVVLLVGKYLTRKTSTSCCHVVMEARGKDYSHYLALPFKENKNRRNLIESSDTEFISTYYKLQEILRCSYLDPHHVNHGIIQIAAPSAQKLASAQNCHVQRWLTNTGSGTIHGGTSIVK